jgi:hypothetical protein
VSSMMLFVILMKPSCRPASCFLSLWLCKRAQLIVVWSFSSYVPGSSFSFLPAGFRSLLPAAAPPAPSSGDKGSHSLASGCAAVLHIFQLLLQPLGLLLQLLFCLRWPFWGLWCWWLH